MGANGTPATVFALMGFGWWTISTLIPGEKEFRQFNPIRLGLAIYLGVVLLSWAVGKMRPLTALEATTSDRGLMAMFGLAGVVVLAIDGLRSMDEVARVVDWLIGCAMVMVTVGLIQFFFGYDLARNIRIPGLQYNAQIAEINMRSDFNRPRATAGHPIEFGVVSAAVLRSLTGGRAGGAPSERSSRSQRCSSPRWVPPQPVSRAELRHPRDRHAHRRILAPAGGLGGGDDRRNRRCRNARQRPRRHH